MKYNNFVVTEVHIAKKFVANGRSYKTNLLNKCSHLKASLVIRMIAKEGPKRARNA